MRFLENRIPPPIVTLLTCLVMGFVAWLFPGWISPANIGFGIAAAMLTLGVFLLLPAVLLFRRARTTINPVQIGRASTLVTTGIYRYTRNPMYLGMASIITSLAFALGNPWFLAGTLFFVSFITRFQIIPEERAIEQKFGTEYQNYRTRVRRWI